jgi:cytidine deaminase
MKLAPKDEQLIEIASKLVKPAVIPGGVIAEVGSALRTAAGEVFSGVSMHLVCGLGSCAEHTAIATAITNAGAIEIDAIVATNEFGIIPPCGRCRELMNVLSVDGSKTWIILGSQEKVQLADLLPRSWNAKTL